MEIGEYVCEIDCRLEIRESPIQSKFQTILEYKAHQPLRNRSKVRQINLRKFFMNPFTLPTPYLFLRYLIISHLDNLTSSSFNFTCLSYSMK